MRKIEKQEHHKIMLEILEYFDKVCRENNINYSLIGGSLIGAIRHKGIIPWDDDIDVVLTRDNYRKIVKILETESNGKYKLLNQDTCKGYFFPFSKLVNTETYVVEPKNLTPFNNWFNDYGIYVDIFCYNNLPSEIKERNKQIKKIKLLNSMLSRKKLDFKHESLKRNFLRFNKNILSVLFGYKRVFDMLDKMYEKSENIESEYVISNWPIYSTNKEIQLKKNTLEYIDTKFENLTVMVFKNYDEILRTSFGNYMELPPVEKRVAHDLEAYWR